MSVMIEHHNVVLPALGSSTGPTGPAAGAATAGGVGAIQFSANPTTSLFDSSQNLAWDGTHLNVGSGGGAFGIAITGNLGLTATIVQATTAFGFISSDGTHGMSGKISPPASFTVKDGLVVSSS